MVSNISVISSGWLTVTTMGCELSLASSLKTGPTSSGRMKEFYERAEIFLVKEPEMNIGDTYNVPGRLSGICSFVPLFNAMFSR